MIAFVFQMTLTLKINLMSCQYARFGEDKQKEYLHFKIISLNLDQNNDHNLGYKYETNPYHQ